MISSLMQRRRELTLGATLISGLLLLAVFPFPSHRWLFQLLLAERPAVFYFLGVVYVLLCLVTPLWFWLGATSLAYILIPQSRSKARLVSLPPLPESSELSLVIGELHHERTERPSENPRWLIIPERGLFTGIAIVGAIGSGKTTGCMYPFAKQVLCFGEEDRHIGGLVLEVKGDFCHRVREILTSAGRSEDYVEINLTGSEYRYNPLWNDLDAYALAYGIATLLTSLFGKGREPFWQQAYTNMMKFIILLHRVLYDYVTLLDIYECAINPDLLKSKVELAEAAVAGRKLAVIDQQIYMDFEVLARFKWEVNPASGMMESPLTEDLSKCLLEYSLLHQIREEEVLPAGVGPIRGTIKEEHLQAVRRWFYEDWMRIEQRLRTSIVEGIAFFLSLFDDNPTLKRVFCPPKECYDALANADGRFGRPLAPFAELIEHGKVVALNFPVSANPGLARMVGTLMKVDFQRAVLNRVPAMEANPTRYFRQVLFLCDEYHAFATVGEGDPTGDEKFFSLSRQSRCIPIVATQSISSLRSALSGEAWRTLLQTFRTKIFLTLSDDFSARVASDLCGRDEQLKPSYNFSESGQDAKVSFLTGRAMAHRSSVTASKNYSLQKDHIFEARVFSELKNAQAVVLAYDGLNPLPPTFCYLKPYFLDFQTSYFEHLREGRL